MPGQLTPDTIAAFGRFFTGGDGPRHRDLDDVFTACGMGDVAPYDDSQPTKEQRVRRTLTAAQGGARERAIVERLLSEMRVHGCFDRSADGYNEAAVRALREALARSGWELGEGGDLSAAGQIDLETGGRHALDEQLRRLRANVHDPALLLGTAKELLESVAKYVLEELGVPVRDNMDFAELWFHARDRLGIHPNSISADDPGAEAMRRILGSAWTIADQVNHLRATHGTGHGRTLLTGVTPEAALLVVREACSVAELALRTLDRQLGR